jgi:hypothetical protein
MPSKGRAYPITDQWKGWVDERLTELGITRAELARRIGVKRHVVTELLAEDRVQSPLVPAVHKALGWPPPALTLEPHVLQMIEMFRKLSPVEQGQWHERMASDARKRK